MNQPVKQPELIGTIKKQIGNVYDDVIEGLQSAPKRLSSKYFMMPMAISCSRN